MQFQAVLLRNSFFWLNTLASKNENPFLYGMSIYMIFLALLAICAVFIVKDKIKF